MLQSDFGTASPARGLSVASRRGEAVIYWLLSIKCRYSMDIEVRIGFLSMKCRCFMDGCLGLEWVFA